jgi:hypothetical protein
MNTWDVQTHAPSLMEEQLPLSAAMKLFRRLDEYGGLVVWTTNSGSGKAVKTSSPWHEASRQSLGLSFVEEWRRHAAVVTGYSWLGKTRG